VVPTNFRCRMEVVPISRRLLLSTIWAPAQIICASPPCGFGAFEVILFGGIALRIWSCSCSIASWFLG
jgi:hypothetical protein